MADYQVNTTLDENDGSAEIGTGLSLRDAILITNSTPEEDTIRLESATYELTIEGDDSEAVNDPNEVGDLDVNGNSGALFIRGAEDGGTFIDGNGIISPEIEVASDDDTGSSFIKFNINTTGSPEPMELMPEEPKPRQVLEENPSLEPGEEPDPTQVIELFRFRNTTFDTGTYVFVDETERSNILEDDDLRNIFSLEGEQSDGTINPAFTASTVSGDNLIPVYRLKDLGVPGSYLFVGVEEYDAIFAEDSVQRYQWEQEGLNEAGEDIPEFYLYSGSSEKGSTINRLQNTENGTYLYAGEAETEAIESDPSLSNLFTNQGLAFKSLL